ILLLLSVSKMILASCDFYSGDYLDASVTLDNIIVQRDTPPGTVLETKNISFTKFGPYCDNGAYAVWDVGIFSTESSISHVYETNLEGIGIRVSTDYGVIRNDHLTPPQMWQNLEAVKVEIVKTEGIAQSGGLNSGMIMRWDVGDGPDSALTMPIMKLYMTGGNITSLKCSIQSGATLAFPMGNIPSADFDHTGAFSKTTQTVNLKLDCDEDANVNVTLNGTQNPDTSDNSVIALSEEENVATGVGVQILYDNNPLKINEMLNLNRSAGGPETYPFTARYIQTKDKIRAGKANAIATLNVTYQ
ncbi:TPA: fimbrial protein, partial [Enterobacter asburiae]|nr:fimbrial protein [Enterobacter asburiae]